MPVQVRILHKGDESLLENLASDVFDDPIVSKSLNEFLESPFHHLVAAIDLNQVVGFASAVHYLHPDKSKPEFWINEIGVSPSYQGRGIGKMLMNALLEEGRNVGCSDAWVLTERANLPAMSLYKSVKGKEELQDTVMFSFKLDADQD